MILGETKRLTLVFKNLNFWINGIVRFSYDKSKRLNKGELNGMDGYNAKIFFKYDDDGKLIKLKWKFLSIHKEFTYNFKYKKIN